MSRPFPYPTVKKDSPFFDDYMSNFSASAVDLHRSVGQFSLVSVPASATSTGRFGMFAVASGYLYVCTDTNTWERVALSTW